MQSVHRIRLFRRQALLGAVILTALLSNITPASFGQPGTSTRLRPRPDGPATFPASPAESPGLIELNEDGFDSSQQLRSVTLPDGVKVAWGVRFTPSPAQQ